MYGFFYANAAMIFFNTKFLLEKKCGYRKFLSFLMAWLNVRYEFKCKHMVHAGAVFLSVYGLLPPLLSLLPSLLQRAQTCLESNHTFW